MRRFLRLGVGAGKRSNGPKTGAPDLVGKPGRGLRSMFWLIVLGPLCACGVLGMLANLRGTPTDERNIEVPAVVVAVDTAVVTLAPAVEPMAPATVTAWPTDTPVEAPAALATATATTLPTSTPTASATSTVAPSATEQPTSTPTVAPTPTSTATSPATAIPSGPVTNSGANLREGPGTDYAVIGGVSVGQPLEPVGQNSAGDWLQLASGSWIAAALVDNAPGGLPVTAVAAQLAGGNPTAPAVAPTPGGWSREERGVIFRSECPCDQGDAMNCGDFGLSMDGQACYMRCMDLVGYDVHRLDRDKDGSACEWSW